MTDDYEFSADWLAGSLYLFEPNLRHLAGTPCRILEIGSFEGRSTTWLLDHVATHERATIDCVDIEFRPPFLRNIAKHKDLEKIYLHRGRSREVLRDMRKADFDFIYIDGDHSTVTVLEDAVLSFRSAKIGAVIAFDDYLWEDPAFAADGFAKPAVDAFLSIYASRIEILEISHQVWIRKLRDDVLEQS